MTSIKKNFSGSSVTCPKCQHHWMRKPSMEEKVVIATGSGAGIKEILFLIAPRCALCGGKFKSLDEATIDHIIPKSRGGTNSWRNYQLAHGLCNQKKGSTLPTVWDKSTILSLLLESGHLMFGEMAEGETFLEFAENVAERLSEV